jgi:hypothetical protein
MAALFPSIFGAKSLSSDELKLRELVKSAVEVTKPSKTDFMKSVEDLMRQADKKGIEPGEILTIPLPDPLGGSRTTIWKKKDIAWPSKKEDLAAWIDEAADLSGTAAPGFPIGGTTIADPTWVGTNPILGGGIGGIDGTSKISDFMKRIEEAERQIESLTRQNAALTAVIKENGVTTEQLERLARACGDSFVRETTVPILPTPTDAPETPESGTW